jgi:hypothetical protein
MHSPTTGTPQIYWPYPWSQPAEDAASPIRRARYDNLTAAGLENYASFLHSFSELSAGENECAGPEPAILSPRLDPISL